MTILDNNGTDTIIARDGEFLVHVAVITRNKDNELESSLPKTGMKRFTELGRIMADQDIEGAEFRLDTIIIRAIAEDRALLRYHRNTLSDDVIDHG